MRLIQIEEERSNHTGVYCKIVHTEEEIQAVRDKLKETEQRLYSSSGFVGYYHGYVSELDIKTVTIDQLKGLTLAEVGRLIKYATELEEAETKKE